MEREMEVEELKTVLEEGAGFDHFKADADKEVTEWKSEKACFTAESEFAIPNEIIRCLLSSEYYDGMLISGEGGIGKTVLTLGAVKSILKPEQWEYANGYTTPLALYEYLYSNRDKKVIVLDDVEGLFSNPLSISILKGALWDADGKRIVQYSSKSDKATFPSRFVMKAKFIILCNSVPKGDPTMRAMLTRTISYDLSFSFEQKIGLCRKFIEKDDTLAEEEKAEVLAMLGRNVNEATKDFNFRTLRKLIAFVRYDKRKAETLFKATTETDDVVEAYLEVSRAGGTVEEQSRRFFEATGRKRRTFFNIKKRLSAKVQLKQDVALALQNKGGIKP